MKRYLPNKELVPERHILLRVPQPVFQGAVCPTQRKSELWGVWVRGEDQVCVQRLSAIIKPFFIDNCHISIYILDHFLHLKWPIGNYIPGVFFFFFFFFFGFRLRYSSIKNHNLINEPPTLKMFSLCTIIPY